MPKVSNFTQLPFPLPTNNFTAEGEAKAAHGLLSRVLWDGGETTGVGDPPVLDITGSTHLGSTTIPANFFNTYRAILFEATIDMSGIIDGGTGHLMWEASTGGGPVGPTETIPWNSPTYGFPDPDDKTGEFKLRLVVDGTGLASLLRFTIAKDDHPAYVGLVRYATQPFDGSLSGVSFATPITLAFSLVYGQPLEPLGPTEPVCLFSRLSY
jgi:hypothetical protein